MEEIFSYNQYEQVLCLCFRDNESLVISRSSNRVIRAEQVKKVDKDTFFVKDELLEFFKLHSKSENQQTENEKTRLSSIINFIKQLKDDIIQEDISIFDKSQIIFYLPAEWTEGKYENDLRALFLKAGWINKEDHKNRLIFSTFIERFVHYLQMYEYNNIKLERERKYILFYMDETSIRLICYQMQCTKELIAVSKKLAVSDFLLIPTVLDDEPICLSSFDEITQNIIERMFTTRQNVKNTTLKKSVLRKMANKILQRLDDISRKMNTKFDTTLAMGCKNSFNGDEVVQEYMEVLEGWNYSTFIKDILNDTDIEQLLHKIVDTFKRIRGKYNQVENSPDGVQAIILWDGFCPNKRIYQDLVLKALLKAEIIDVKSKFIDFFSEIFLIEAAMQKPYKMIQIANVLSPPDILNKDNLFLYPHLVEHGWQENDLLQPNSFYVQAYVYENHIDFILNKVIAVPSIDDATQKSTFTIQERSINVESITDTVCDIMWNYFQALDFEDYDNKFFWNCCDKHGVGELNAENCFSFRANLRILMSNWFQDENIFSDQELDINQSIPRNINCTCVLNITYRMLIELALMPAITNTAAVITSTLASNDLFGLYDVSALIIINESENIAFNRFDSILKDAILKRLQVHQKSPVVFYGEKELVACKLLGNWVHDVKQILGRGSFLQVSSTSYIVKIGRGPLEVNDFFDCSSNFYEVSQIKQACNFYILKKDDCLHQEGMIKRFITEDNEDNYCIEIFMVTSSQAGESRIRIMFSYFKQIYTNYPRTIKISPQHYSSTVKIEVSYIHGGSDPYGFSNSITIQEKLVLKQ